jgi:hypothetical protein
LLRQGGRPLGDIRHTLAVALARDWLGDGHGSAGVGSLGPAA